MRLSDLILGAKTLPLDGGASDQIEVAALTADSRLVTKGALFAALRGVQADGTNYIEAAIDAGACAILTHDDVDVVPFSNHDGVAFVRAKSPRHTLALMAANFYQPAPNMIVAVTGTNGKTSIANFARQIWAAMGVRGASFGTIGAQGPTGTIKLDHTTPDPVTLHKVLQQLCTTQSVTHLALEASSHGLAQHRLDGLKVNVAAFTNITRDHLDYHGTLEAYFDEKKKLFTHLLVDDGTVVFDQGVERSQDIRAIAQQRGLAILDVGIGAKGISLLEETIEGYGTRLKLASEGKDYDLLLPLAGSFQTSNALVAAGLVMATGFPASDVLPKLEQLMGAPGRLDMVATSKTGGLIFIDYAHTSDALLNVLEALRPYTKGRLGVVFGCGGDRDVGKRGDMGQVAHEQADFVIVTDDNPRSEDPDLIRQAILKTARDAQDIGDRHDAIAAGIDALQAGDVLLIAGKGHETGQIVKDQILPFSDHEVVQSLVAIPRSGVHG